MNVHSPTTTIRVRADLREPLERAVKLTRRSRSFIIMEALERHLEDIVREQSLEPPKRRLTRLLAIAGNGTSSDHVRSGDEIIDHIRWLRDDE
jgi:predicted transcriptional regulator